MTKASTYDLSESIKSMDALSKRIRDERKSFECKVDFDDIHRRCIATFDRTLKLLLEMETFVERNIDVLLVDRECKLRYCGEEKYGLSTVNHPVLKSFLPGDRVVCWIDDGLWFVYDRNAKKVLSVCNNRGQERTDIGRGRHINLYWQHNDYIYFPTFERNHGFLDHETLFPTEGYARFFNPCSSNGLVPKPDTVEGMKKVLIELLKDYENAQLTYTCLTEAFGLVEKVEREYNDEFMEMVGKLED